VHSRYLRRLADWGVGGREVQVELTTRRFFCDEPACARTTFAEQVPGVTVRHGRHTGLAAQHLQVVAMALGGRAGARLVARLATPVSRMTLLRVIRRVPDPAMVTPRVLGVDEFAQRRGHRYATVLIDMDTHRPVDVLPDRTADTLAAWLQAHPGVEVVCRDRSGSYADGITRGAPGAKQIADRWHLLHNLSGAVEKVVGRHRRCLRQPAEHRPSAEPSQAQPTPRADGRRPTNTRRRHVEVHALLAEGMAIKAIARRLGLDRKTVRKYARADSPEQLIGPNPSSGRGVLGPFKPYLADRCATGHVPNAVLYDEIRARGYRGSERTLRAWLAGIRRAEPVPAAPPVPSTRQIASWIMRPDDKLSDDDRTGLKDARARCPDLDILTRLAHGFTDLVRQRRGAELQAWIDTAQYGPFPELRGFANGLLNDLAAVKGGLTEHWSSGAVEGHVNRIKTIKRQMYGRAKLDLLRTRILHPT
jgi:transposase